MIYLSGAMQAARMGERKDVGLMLGYRTNGRHHGKRSLPINDTNN